MFLSNVDDANTGKSHDIQFNSSNQYPALGIGIVDSNFLETNCHPWVLPPYKYYRYNNELRDLQFETNLYSFCSPIMESYNTNSNYDYLSSNNISNFTCENSYNFNAEYNLKNNYNCVLDDNIPLNSTNNIFNYNQSIDNGDNLYDTQLAQNLSSNYCNNNLFEDSGYSNWFIDKYNSDLSTIPNLLSTQYAFENNNCEESDSANSCFDYDYAQSDILENEANIDFLKMSDKQWKRYRSSGMFKLGNKGRSQLKSKISKHLKQNPELRKKINRISGVRRATTRQLFQLAQICGITSHLTTASNLK